MSMFMNMYAVKWWGGGLRKLSRLLCYSKQWHQNDFASTFKREVTQANRNKSPVWSISALISYEQKWIHWVDFLTFFKGDVNSCIPTPSEKVSPKRNKFASQEPYSFLLRLTLIEKKRKNIFDRVAFFATVSIPLKNNNSVWSTLKVNMIILNSLILDLGHITWNAIYFYRAYTGALNERTADEKGE